MKTAFIIAKDELRYWKRSNLAFIALIALITLSAVSVLVSITEQSRQLEERLHEQAESDAILAAQPDRHPHRMVHYGHYVYQTPSPLAVVDPGVDAFVGTSVFLEGHRQNTAAFISAAETGLLARFGSFSPAFALQVLIPLLMILCGFSSVARERDQQTLHLLLGQGISNRSLLLGKFIALLVLVAGALLPLLLVGLYVTAGDGGITLALLFLVLGYGVYLAIWAQLIIGISGMAASSKASLLTLLGVWATFTVLVPRFASDVTANLIQNPSQIETGLAIAETLRTAGDGHDASDPAFRNLQEITLAENNVARIEDLPFNYRGLVAIRAEEDDARIYNEYARQKQESELQQSALANRFGLLTPLIAMRSFSMALAGTNLAAHHRFLTAAEDYRYDMVQKYNRLQMEAITFADDIGRSNDAVSEQRTRVSSQNWADMPEFTLAMEPLKDRFVKASSAVFMLLGWAFLATLFMAFTSRRLHRL
jgi:ABC-2 type transport system permease protein